MPDFAVADLVGMPLEIIPVGDRLVSVDIGDSTVFRWYDLATPSIHYDFGRRGRGPNEFTRPWSFLGLRGEQIGVVDAANRTFSAVDMNALAVIHQRTISAEGLPLYAVDSGPDTHEISVGGIFADARLIRVDSSGAVISKIGELPSPGDGFRNMQPRHFSGKYAAHPAGSMWAVALERVDIIELWTDSGELRHVTVGPRFVDEVSNTSNGYRSIAATSSAIFALLVNPDYNGDSAVGHDLVIIDWDGLPINRFSLDGEFFHIAVDTDGLYLYASRHFPYPAIGRIPVQDLLPWGLPRHRYGYVFPKREDDVPCVLTRANDAYVAPPTNIEISVSAASFRGGRGVNQ